MQYQRFVVFFILSILQFTSHAQNVILHDDGVAREIYLGIANPVSVVAAAVIPVRI